MKRLISRILCLCLLVATVCSSSIMVYAAEESEIQPLGLTSKIVTDSSGNRYGVGGATYKMGKAVTVLTDYYVSYYYAGTQAAKNTVDNYSKSLTAKGTVYLLGGGSNTLGGTASRSGAQNNVTYNGSYLYTVTSIFGTHSFSCNGASWSGSTSE